MMQCWRLLSSTHLSRQRCANPKQACPTIDTPLQAHRQPSCSLTCPRRKLQTFRALFLDVRQPSLSSHSRRSFVSCSLSATLVIRSPMIASVQEAGFVIRCSIIVTSFAVFLRTTTAFSPMAAVNSDAPAFASSMRKSTARSNSVFKVLDPLAASRRD